MNALDDNFHPVRAPLQPEDEQYWFPYWNETCSKSSDGAKSSVREVDMKVPKYLEDCHPVANEKCYLHVIDISAKYPIPTSNQREKCDQLLTSTHELGIITKKRLPQVCNFPVFSDLGEVEIDIGTNHRSFTLTKEQLSAISKFHRVIFMKAIQVVKKFLVYSEGNDAVGYLIVPLKPFGKYGMKIDFGVVFNQCDIFDVEEPSTKARRERLYSREDYSKRVLIPWHQKHNEDSKNYYVVTNVDERKNMYSPFPNKKYESYAHYYKIKHNLQAFNPHQPLMEARPITHHLDCLRPRAISSDQSTKKDQFSFFLVPEFCIKQTFPAYYWYKATLLPTVLHRLQYLLLAEELRESIVIEAGIGKLEWYKDKTDILEVRDKYNIPSSQQRREEKFSNVERSTLPISENIPRTYVSNFHDPPPLNTLIKYTNYEGPKQKEIFEALTPAGCNDILDLERLETLGDSFLKYAVSVTIFVKHSTVNEGYLTSLKGRVVGNRNLMYCGNRFNLSSFIKVNTFSAHSNWCPPGFAVPEILKGLCKIIPSYALFHIRIPYADQFSGVISQNTIAEMKADAQKFMATMEKKSVTQKRQKTALSYLGKQSVGDKTIADVVEALVGVYLKTGGIQSAYQLLNYFGILANSKYDEVMGTQTPSPLFEESELTIENIIPGYNELENLLSYRFRDKAYIVQALTHPSYLENTMTNCYQTLEFIGDAVLDFLITSYIYQYCGDLSPGKLTDLKASLVNNITFGAIAVRLGLHKYLLSNSKELTDAINGLVDYQRQRNYQIHGNEMMILISDVVAEEVKVPKVLSDIFESLAGAIYLDSGNDLKIVWRIYYNIMREEIEKFSLNIPINPVRAVYEIPNVKVNFIKETPQMKENINPRKYFNEKKMIKLSIVKDNNEFVYWGRGENLDLCKRAAAKLALSYFIRKNEFVI